MDLSFQFDRFFAASGQLTRLQCQLFRSFIRNNSYQVIVFNTYVRISIFIRTKSIQCAMPAVFSNARRSDCFNIHLNKCDHNHAHVDVAYNTNTRIASVIKASIQFSYRSL